jgi:hypothetical protein
VVLAHDFAENAEIGWYFIAQNNEGVLTDED